jgi:hypothetical protein
MQLRFGIFAHPQCWPTAIVNLYVEICTHWWNARWQHQLIIGKRHELLMAVAKM